MRIVIEGEFVTLNEYISAERSNRFKAAKIKKEATEAVMYQTLGTPIITKYPVRIKFHWYWKNTRPDPDNIAFCKKFLLDGLQESHVLASDNWKHVCGGFEDKFSVDADNPRVEIEILEA